MNVTIPNSAHHDTAFYKSYKEYVSGNSVSNGCAVYINGISLASAHFWLVYHILYLFLNNIFFVLVTL